MLSMIYNYSVLRATTGSFLLAYLDGINPDITVKIMLIKTNIIAEFIGKVATLFIPAKLFIIIFIGIFRSKVITIPNVPDISPIINVSALNTRDISFFLAPIALKIPISFVLSKTDI